MRFLYLPVDLLSYCMSMRNQILEGRDLHKFWTLTFLSAEPHCYSRRKDNWIWFVLSSVMEGSRAGNKIWVLFFFWAQSSGLFGFSGLGLARLLPGFINNISISVWLFPQRPLIPSKGELAEAAIAILAVVSGQQATLPVLKMQSLCWGFWRGINELGNKWNLMRALCQCSLCFLESSRLVYIILASWASMVMNHWEKPDRAADRIYTETHVEETPMLRKYMHSFIGQPSLWLCCPHFRNKNIWAHFSLIVSICWHGWRCFYIYDAK